MHEEECAMNQEEEDVGTYVQQLECVLELRAELDRQVAPNAVYTT